MFKRFLFFTLTFLIVSACKKDNTVYNGVPYNQQNFSFNGRVNNQLISYSDSTSGVVNTASRKPATSKNKYLEEQSSAFTGTMVGVTVNAGINIYEYFPTAPNDTVLNTMFSTGSYQFWNPNNSASGVEVFWYDGTKMWSSAYGKADQSGGSFFNITSHTSNTSSDTTYKYITGGNTSCVLYDGLGNTMQLNYSTFKIKTIHY